MAGRDSLKGAGMMSYKRARADFEHLETIAELCDQMELDAEREALMRNPTKAKAGEMYEAACRLWFDEHGVVNGTEAIAKRIMRERGQANVVV
jgi:hypothetical protein